MSQIDDVNFESLWDDEILFVIYANDSPREDWSGFRKNFLTEVYQFSKLVIPQKTQ